MNFIDWITLLGFIITLFTLTMTLNIRGKIERSLGKQRFLQQREKLLQQLNVIRAGILRPDETDRLDARLLDLRALSLQLKHYSIWHMDDQRKLNRFIKYVAGAYNMDNGKSPKVKELVMRIDEIVAIVKAQSEV